jgi:hypothetical protein
MLLSWSLRRWIRQPAQVRSDEQPIDGLVFYSRKRVLELSRVFYLRPFFTTDDIRAACVLNSMAFVSGGL